MKLLGKLLEKIENSKTSFPFWAISFLTLIIIRIFEEHWVGTLRNRSGIFIFYEFTHTFLFFLFAYFVFLGILRKILKVEISKISNILFFGFLLFLSPPIIDYVVSGGKELWSFYDFGGIKDLAGYFVSFFDDSPDMGITYGVRFEIFWAIIFIFIYSYFKTKKILKSLSASFAAYTAFFILGTFPSWITILVNGFSEGFISVDEIDTVRMFLVPVKLFSRDAIDILSSFNAKMSLIYSLILTVLIPIGLSSQYKNKFIAFVKNIRIPQIIYHGGLLCIGMGLAIIFTDGTIEISLFNILSFFVLIIAVSFAWITSLIVNDSFDKKIDAISNESRPLINGVFTESEYWIIGFIFFVFSILLAAIVNFKVAFLLVAYQAIAWAYSAWPPRFKRFAFVSTFVSSLASIIILFSGYVIISSSQNLRSLPFNIVLLLVVGYTLSLPIKDFKDIEGDKEDGITTIPILFGVEWGKIVVGGGIFLSYLLSVVLLNEFRLFWWALFFGGLSFWIVISMQSTDKKTRIHYNNITWWIMGLVFLYGLLLVKVAFL